jgi:hypothetical protein
MYTKLRYVLRVRPRWLVKEAAFYGSLLLTAAATAVGPGEPAGQLGRGR